MQRISSEWPLDSDESLPKTRFFIDASFWPVVAFPVLFFVLFDNTVLCGYSEMRKARDNIYI